MSDNQHLPAVILAGGRSTRMGEDKALVRIDGQRLVDIVLARLRPQVGAVVVAGPQDYGLGLPCLPDHADFQGPCAGVLAGAVGLEGRTASAGFLSVPVDGPFLPPDLARRLSQQPTASAVARDEAGVHATFAYWTFAGIRRALETLERQSSLRRLATLAGAHEVFWSGRQAFCNINTPGDLDLAIAQGSL